MNPKQLRALAEELRPHGFDIPSDSRVVEMAREYAGTLLPVYLLAAWLERCPELALVSKSTATADKPTQSSEPVRLQPGAYGLNPMPDQRAIKINDPIQAAEALARLRGEQVAVPDPQDVLGTQGDRPILDDNGKPLVALVMMGQGGKTFPCHFLDKKGTMIMARVVNTRSVVNVPAVAIDPKDRADVVERLNRLPGANAEFNFDPHEGAVDPWDSTENASG